MALKSVAKLAVPGPLVRFVQQQIEVDGFSLLGVTLEHVAAVESLPFHYHDPYDRLLVAQALAENPAIVSADAIFRRCGAKRAW